LASKKGPVKDQHKGLTGLGGAKVNCAYCHSPKKANNPKTEDNDLNALKEEQYCAIKGCHPDVDKK
jgi:mono/diheme cytochrome c family protein